MTQRNSPVQVSRTPQNATRPRPQELPAAQAKAAPDLLIQTAATHPETLSANDGAQLQRAIGNRAVSRVLASAPPFSARATTNIQTKLQVGPAGDKYEQEADRVADSVMRSLASPLSAGAPDNPDDSLLRRKVIVQRWNHSVEEEPSVGAEGGPVARSFENALQRARGGGQPIETGLRTRLEQGMGTAFDRVRVHTDAQADSLSRSVSARAFTAGADIFFRSGEYNPGSSSGQRLLAHELTHVVQQGAATQNAQRMPDEIQRKGKKGEGDIAALEQDLTPNFPPTSKDAAAGYQVTVGVARVLPEFLPFAKERMKSTLRNKLRSKARSIPLLKGLVREAKTGDEIKTKAARKAVSIVKAARNAQDTTASQQEIQKVIANSDSTGHSWIKFSTLNDGGQPIKTYSFGFYSSTAPARPTDTVAGQVLNPDIYFEDNQETRFLDTRVSAAKYAQGLDKAVQLKANPPAYTTIDYNCTKFVREVAKAAGAAFPSGSHMMIPFSNAGQIRLFHKAFAPNALFDKIEESGKGYENSQESQMLKSGDFTLDQITGQLQQVTKEQKQMRTEARVELVIRANADRIGDLQKQDWLELGLTSDRVEDLSDEKIGALVSEGIDIGGVFAAFGLDIPKIATFAPGKIGKIIKSFNAPTLHGRRMTNIKAGDAVRISKIRDSEVEFEVARAGQFKMELSEFAEYVDFSG